MSDLLDINVWLALIDKRHIHHPAASRYWADASVQSRAFCRVTANGFLRLCTQARALSNPLILILIRNGINYPIPSHNAFDCFVLSLHGF